MPNALETSAEGVPHHLESDFVRDQLVQRTVDLNGKRHNPDGEYVLYWMQSTHRLDENWALRAAVRAANKVGRPLIIHQGLDPTYPYASDRHHTFILQGARDTAQRAAELGLHYQFVLRRKRDDDRRVVDRLAARAYLVVTDLFPTAGVRERSERFAERALCRVLAVESSCVVPSGLFPAVEYAARTIRPKIARVLAHSLEAVVDEVPRVAASPALIASLEETNRVSTLELTSLNDEARDTMIAREIALCEFDHSVPPVSLRGGSQAAHARLQEFVEHRLATYETQRNEASIDGTSGLSPYLHYGHVSSAQVVRAALASGAPATSIDMFVQQATTWRELSFNWCLRTRAFDDVRSLPNWIQRTMAEHANDPRPALYDFESLEQGRTGDDLWNAAQRQLLETGVIHNYPRMLWGKTMLLWTQDYDQACRWLFHLNDKWALDGRDPNSVGGIMWCFGLWDRPWGNKPVWGGIRPMVTSRARTKFDVGGYVHAQPRHVAIVRSLSRTTMEIPHDIIPSLDEVKAAAHRLQAILSPTACPKSAALSSHCGVDVFLKRELDNPTGSFKVRGAYNVLASMNVDERSRGVVASSAGNHGLGVAFAAKAFGAPAMLYVPATAPQVKKEGIRALGTRVNDEEPDYDAAMVRAKVHASEHHIRFINPCLGVDLLAGQGTVALEVLQQQPHVRTIVVCTGGGGLLGGMGAVLRAVAPHVRIVGAQSEETAAMTRSLAAGKVVDIPNTPTLADGLAGQIDDDALHIGQYCADDMALVSEAEIGETIAWLSRNEHMTVEGAGAVAVAALRYNRIANLQGPVVAIVSGRNIDAIKHAALLTKYAAT